MRTSTTRSAAGRHRKITTSQSFKGRVALVAAAAGTVSAAGVGGAAAATLQADQRPVDVELTTNAETVNPGEAQAADAAQAEAEAEAAALEASTPQVLSIAEYKPTSGLEEQLGKAVQAVEDRRASEAAAAAEAAAQAAAEEAKSALEAQGISTDGITGASVVKPAEGAFTSGYGARWGTIHAGIDIAAPIGTPILAAMDGTVIDSGPASGYGNWIRIKHDDGSVTVYGHMATLNVGVGERVIAGQQIAGMGNEGHSTGPHLHFEIHPSGNGAVDPLPWFSQHGISI